MAEKNHSRSKKISELRALSYITSHQDHSWIPLAQYDSRVNAYTNISINLQAITSYSVNKSYAYSTANLEYATNYIDNKIAYTNTYVTAAVLNNAYAYTTEKYADVINKIGALTAQTEGQLDAIGDLYKLKTSWESLESITKGKDYNETSAYIKNNDIANTIVGYTTAYSMEIHKDLLKWQTI